MSTDRYLTLAAPAEGSYTERRSRFLAFALPVRDEAEAKARLREYQNKYHDARHVCHAYVLGEDGSLTRSSDAGEPSGTAGRPILGQIRSAGLTGCLVVVVRYYGGTPLGAANLGRAYQTAAAEALRTAKKRECIMTEELHLDVPYEAVDAAMKILRELDATVTARQYAETGQQLTVAVPRNNAEALRRRLTRIHTLRLTDPKN